MANENNQKRSINRFFLFANIFPFAFFVLLVIGVSILASVYVSTQAVGALIGMIVFAVLMAAGYLAVVVFYYKNFNAIFVRGLNIRETLFSSTTITGTGTICAMRCALSTPANTAATARKCF